MTKKLFIILLSTFYFLLSTHAAFAQSANSAGQVDGAATLGVANMVVVKDINVKDGSILSSSPKGAVLSTLPYDSQVVGIVSRDAGIILSSTDQTNSVPVIS